MCISSDVWTRNYGNVWQVNTGICPIASSVWIEVEFESGRKNRDIAGRYLWGLDDVSPIKYWRLAPLVVEEEEEEVEDKGYETKDSGARVEFDSGMIRDISENKARFELMLPLGIPYDKQFITRCAELLGRGAKKYDPRNWEKANGEAELQRFKESAMRHLIQWINGEDDEDHSAAVFFNLMGAETVKYKMEHKDER